MGEKESNSQGTDLGDSKTIQDHVYQVDINHMDWNNRKPENRSKIAKTSEYLWRTMCSSFEHMERSPE